MIYDVRIEALELSCVFDLKGTPTEVAARLLPLRLTLPNSPNTATQSDDMMLCWVGPAQWILRAPLAMEPQLTSRLQHLVGDDVTPAVEISDTLQFFSIRGIDADNVLAVCCPLDLHPTTFPSNAVSFTEFLEIKALLLRVSDGFEFAVDRSYGDFVNDNLHRILGTPLAIDHAGQAPAGAGLYGPVAPS